MREATIATSLLVDFIAYLGRVGIDAETVCREARLEPHWLSEPHSRVPASAMQRLWATGQQLTGDADLGLHSAESYNPGALSIVGYVILSCRSAAEALEKLVRYAPLLNEGLQVRVVHDQGRTHCRFGPVENLDSFLHHAPRQAMETLAAGIVLTLKRLAVHPPEPLEARFRHTAPDQLAEHHRLLGARLAFGQRENEVVYESSALETGLLSADPGLLAVFEADARNRLAQLKTHGAISARVQTILAGRLRGEVPSLADIASELAMSERSVQRSLSEESTSYREIVDEVRKGLALSHLATPGTTATDVAFLLGFSEPSAFTRAFRRWTGSSPTEFRAA